ncbi:MAG: hypothetical protein FWD68_15770 [Alphaproteobacteria bacterium]|nr:hypothetical protein [Alphaproteobacteria bacterium]
MTETLVRPRFEILCPIPEAIARIPGFREGLWIVRLAGFAFGPDFEEVRPYGSIGDMKCDGRRISSGTVFQCYAPDTMREAALIAKIDRDFQGARAHWGAHMQEWVLVHNDDRGLPPNAVQHLDGLRRAHTPLQIATWSEPELLHLAMKLDLPSLQAIFGYVPSIPIMQGLEFSDIAPVIDALQQHEPDPADPPLTPPSLQKLEKNALSKEAETLLRFGRQKAALVGKFFHKSPSADLGERIAEAFRLRYAELKALDLPPDTIFRHLQDFAGFRGEPRRQGAALAVLTYFFDSCDIFEDPGNPEGPS